MMYNSIADFAALCTRNFDGRTFGGAIDGAGRTFGGGTMMDRYFGGGFGWIGLIAQGLFGLAILTLFVVLIIWLVRLSKRAKNPGAGNAFGGAAGFNNPTASALNLLNERYAKGEIEEEAYLKVKKNLTE